MKVLEGSLLAFSKNNEELINQLNKVKSLGIKNIHYDVMDGVFVENKSFFGEHLKLIKSMGFYISVHLMVKDVSQYVDKFVSYDIDYLTFHCEPITKNECIIEIKKIKNKNIKCGIAIKPKTEINTILDLINISDIITLMSVEPGKGGQEFIENTINKLKEIRLSNNDVLIQIDGGVNSKNLKLIKEYANFFVMGTFLIDNINKLKFIKDDLIR